MYLQMGTDRPYRVGLFRLVYELEQRLTLRLGQMAAVQWSL